MFAQGDHINLVPVAGKYCICEESYDESHKWSATAHLSLSRILSSHQPVAEAPNLSYNYQRRVRKALLSESAPLFPFQVNSWKWEMFEELFARDRLKRLQCLPCAAAFRGELM